jgi:hypothetical protein
MHRQSSYSKTIITVFAGRKDRLIYLYVIYHLLLVIILTRSSFMGL